MAAVDKNFQWFREHQRELFEMHPGKYLIISDNAVQGVYDSEMSAFQVARMRFKPREFLVQHCTETTTPILYHSRVVSFNAD